MFATVGVEWNVTYNGGGYGLVEGVKAGGTGRVSTPFAKQMEALVQRGAKGMSQVATCNEPSLETDAGNGASIGLRLCRTIRGSTDIPGEWC